MEIAKTKEFILRHVKLSDAQILFEIEIDEENIKNMMSYDNKIESIIEGIKKQQAQYRRKKPSKEKIILETPEGVAGFVSIHELNKPYIEHKAKISYALHPKFRGKGLTTKAVKLITKYAFKKYNLKRIEACCRTFNKASARVLEKVGYELEGIHKKDLKKNGKFLDNMYWAKVK
ncbi:MAG: GNAT family N-acetyltransferase [Nanobdellota archaeon]